MTTSKKDSDRLQVKIPKKLDEALDDLASSTGKSKDYHIKRALKFYLEDLEDRLAIEEALKEDDGTRIPWEEISERIDRDLAKLEK